MRSCFNSCADNPDADDGAHPEVYDAPVDCVLPIREVEPTLAGMDLEQLLPCFTCLLPEAFVRGLEAEMAARLDGAAIEDDRSLLVIRADPSARTTMSMGERMRGLLRGIVPASLARSRPSDLGLEIS